MRIRTSLAGLSLGLLLAACGSTQTATVTQTRTVTRTVVRHTPTHSDKGSKGKKSRRPSSGKSFVSSYPPAFAGKFRTACLHAGNGPNYCGCVLHHIERRVPFSVVVTQRQAVFAANPPAWVANAENACFKP